MKKVFTFLLTLSALMVFGQDNAVTKYFSEYLEDPDVTKVSVTSKMFSLFTEFEAEEETDQEILEAISKLKGIKAIMNDHVENGKTLYSNAVQKVGAENYEELMSFEEQHERIQFMILDQNDKIEELLMIRGTNTEFMVMSLFGEIDLNAIAKLSKVMKVRGMEKFKMLDDDHDDNHDKDDH